MQETVLKKMKEDIDDLMQWRQGMWNGLEKLQAEEAEETELEEKSPLEKSMAALTEQEIKAEMATAEFSDLVIERQKEDDEQTIRRIIARFRAIKNPSALQIAEYKHSLKVYKS